MQIQRPVSQFIIKNRGRGKQNKETTVRRTHQTRVKSCLLWFSELVLKALTHQHDGQTKLRSEPLFSADCTCYRWRNCGWEKSPWLASQLSQSAPTFPLACCCIIHYFTHLAQFLSFFCLLARKRSLCITTVCKSSSVSPFLMTLTDYCHLVVRLVVSFHAGAQCTS